MAFVGGLVDDFRHAVLGVGRRWRRTGNQVVDGLVVAVAEVGGHGSWFVGKWHVLVVGELVQHSALNQALWMGLEDRC